MHDGGQYCWRYDGPAARAEGELLCSGITDGDGYCDFHNLPASVYIVQAIHNERRSAYAFAHPACDTVRIGLTSGSRVHIRVLQEGISSVEDAGIESAGIVFRRIEPSGERALFALETDDAGNCTIENAPWGEYHLAATLPAEYGQLSREMTVPVEQSFEEVTVTFDARNDFVIAGTVVEKDSGTAVPDFPLLLRRKTRNHRWIDLAESVSDERGAFEFTGLIPGLHRIANSMKGAGLAHIAARIRYEKTTPIYGHSDIAITDKDVRDVRYIAAPAKETVFAGRVVDESARR